MKKILSILLIALVVSISATPYAKGGLDESSGSGWIESIQKFFAGLFGFPDVNQAIKDAENPNLNPTGDKSQDIPPLDLKPVGGDDVTGKEIPHDTEEGPTNQDSTTDSTPSTNYQNPPIENQQTIHDAVTNTKGLHDLVDKAIERNNARKQEKAKQQTQVTDEQTTGDGSNLGSSNSEKQKQDNKICLPSHEQQCLSNCAKTSSSEQEHLSCADKCPVVQECIGQDVEKTTPEENNKIENECDKIQKQISNKESEILEKTNDLWTEYDELGKILGQLIEKYKNIASKDPQLETDIGRLLQLREETYDAIDFETTPLSNEIDKLKEKLNELKIQNNCGDIFENNTATGEIKYNTISKDEKINEYIKKHGNAIIQTSSSLTITFKTRDKPVEVQIKNGDLLPKKPETENALDELDKAVKNKRLSGFLSDLLDKYHGSTQTDRTKGLIGAAKGVPGSR